MVPTGCQEYSIFSFEKLYLCVACSPTGCLAKLSGCSQTVRNPTIQICIVVFLYKKILIVIIIQMVMFKIILLGPRDIIKEEKGYQPHGILFYLQKEGENT
jgi:hypothetical protein